MLLEEENLVSTDRRELGSGRHSQDTTGKPGECSPPRLAVVEGHLKIIPISASPFNLWSVNLELMYLNMFAYAGIHLKGLI